MATKKTKEISETLGDEFFTKRKVAVIVLGCMLPKYDRAIALIRRSWGAAQVKGVDVYYVYGNAVGDELADLRAYVPGPLPIVEDMQVKRVDDILFTGCSDLTSQQSDCILQKRLLSMEYLLEHNDHDAFMMVSSSSYVHQEELLAHVQIMQKEMVLQGHVFLSEDHGITVVSGSSILLSRDLAERQVHASANRGK